MRPLRIQPASRRRTSSPASQNPCASASFPSLNQLISEQLPPPAPECCAVAEKCILPHQMYLPSLTRRHKNQRESQTLAGDEKRLGPLRSRGIIESSLSKVYLRDRKST